jgi:hypothetical protein
MIAAIRPAILLLAAILSAMPPSRPAKEAEDDPESRFAENVLRVIEWANLAQKGGRTDVAVVVGRNGRLADAEALATRLNNAAADSFLPLRLTAKAYQVLDARVNASQYVSNSAAAVLILQATPAELGSLQAFALDKKALTLSRRPQDIGYVSVVILPAQMYLDGKRCIDENCDVTGTLKHHFHAVAEDYLSYAGKARIAVIKGGKTVDWAEVVRLLRLAIIAREQSPGPAKPVISRASANRPFVPHFDLSEALAMLGDCNAAQVEWRDTSDAAERKGIDRDEFDLVKNHVLTCPAPIVRATKTAQLEPTWPSSSF